MASIRQIARTGASAPRRPSPDADQSVRCEIRECVSTPRGPRQRALASFRGALTPEILDAAEERARRPFDRSALIARAIRMGVPVTYRRRFPEARALLAQLQRGARLEPSLAALLKAALEAMPTEPVPGHLQDAADWIGQSDRARGQTLRGLLRTADRILSSSSRRPLRTRPEPSYPRFSSDRGTPRGDRSE